MSLHVAPLLLVAALLVGCGGASGPSPAVPLGAQTPWEPPPRFFVVVEHFAGVPFPRVASSR